MENVNTALTVTKISLLIALGVVVFIVIKQPTIVHENVAIGSVSAAPAESNNDVIIARVNGQPVYRADMMAAYQGLPQQAQQLGMDVIFPMLIERLVDEKLLSIAADKAVADSDADVQQQLGELRERVKLEIYVTRVLEEAVTDAKLRARYEETVAATPPKEEVRARHILLETEEQANEVLAAVKGGADFAESAKEHSTGPSGPNGGDLGYFAKDQMVAPFADAAFAMKPGEFSAAPVQTEFGWHIIKLEDRRQVEAPAFEEMRDQLTEEMRRSALTAMLEQMRSVAVVEKFDIEGNVPAAAGAEQEQPKQTE